MTSAAGWLLSEQGANILVNDLGEATATQDAESLPTHVGVFVCGPRIAAPDSLVADAVEQVGTDRHHRQRRRLLTGRRDPQDERRMVAANAPHSPRSAVSSRQSSSPALRKSAKRERAEGLEVFRGVVHVLSVSGTMGNAGQTNYAAGKAGIVGPTVSPATNGSVRCERQCGRVRLHRHPNDRREDAGQRVRARRCAGPLRRARRTARLHLA